jgi:hypothetical protein
VQRTLVQAARFRPLPELIQRPSLLDQCARRRVRPRGIDEAEVRCAGVGGAVGGRRHEAVR